MGFDEQSIKRGPRQRNPRERLEGLERRTDPLSLP